MPRKWVVVGRKAGGIVIGVAAALTAVFTWPAGALSPPPVGPPVVPPSPTAPEQIGVLNDASTAPLSFAGAIDNPTPLPEVNSPVPAVCASPCKEFSFVDAASSDFLVALKNTVTGPNGTFNPNDGFDLYVYGPGGTLVASANGIGANGQSVQITNPARGKYTIVVTFTYAEDPNAAYVGEVRLESGTMWNTPTATCSVPAGTPAGCYYLPVLQAVPAYDLSVTGLPPVASTPLGFPLPADVPTSNSCYIDESYGLGDPSPSSIQNPTTRCLRFTSDVQNAGSGDFEVQLPWVTSSGSGGAPQSGFLPGGCQAQQVLTSTSGAQVTRAAGDCEFHPEHGHFHYKNLVSFRLYHYDASAPNGIGAPVGSGLKESFCLTDDDYFGFASKGPNSARQFVGQPNCNVPSDFKASTDAGGTSGAFVIEGISPGWGDVYTWDTPDQYIDITNAPAGTYELVEETNPAGAILVAGPQQTCALTQLQLTATGVTPGTTNANVTCPA
ncbi:MAG TPA: hypothetical protein VFH56_05015 [Acidimicrobiales bacterium]|nr:hypothetical protein [Acidimicrobiales bacterium]